MKTLLLDKHLESESWVEDNAMRIECFLVIRRGGCGAMQDDEFPAFRGNYFFLNKAPEFPQLD